MAFNITSVKTSSNGAWQGDNPLNFAFPLLIVQTALIVAVSRSLAVLFKPLRQPKVIAEIVVRKNYTNKHYIQSCQCFRIEFRHRHSFFQKEKKKNLDTAR